MVDISCIGRQFFTVHGQHLRTSGKRLLAGLMAEHLASKTPKPHCPRPTAPSNTGGAPDPSRRGTPGLPPCNPRRASPGTSAAMATCSAGASAPAVVGRESTDGRRLQRVTYAEAVGGSHGGEASPDESLLTDLTHKLKGFVLVGDFNINAMDNNHPTTKKFENLLRSFGLDLLIRTPTRVTATTQTAIDNVITSLPSVVVSVVNTAISDHYGYNWWKEIRKGARNYQNSKRHTA
ncbi:hypothetical protein J6590_000421 [Homalodisca vitripennis]|nr:hypothetical protein J6590_000421 [Homalodisca vitripennis]